MVPRDDWTSTPGLDAIAARLRFRHLQLLRALGEGRSLRRAAEAVGITQPAATKTLQEIERLFGCQLFDRSQRGLVATSAGEVLLRGARLLLSDLERVRVELQTLGGGGPSLLRLGAPPALAMNLLPGLVRRLACDGSRQIQIFERSSPELLELLHAGDLDAVVARFLPDEDSALLGPVDAGIVFERLLDEEMQVAVRPDHRLAGRKVVNLDDLAGERWILQSGPNLTRRASDALYRQAGLPPPVPVIESDSTPSSLRMVEAGAGISLLPRWGDPSIDAKWQVVWLRLEPRLRLAPVGLFYRRAMSEAPWLAALLRAAREAAAERG
jgi:LysR family transcriptional regulator of abg operon